MTSICRPCTASTSSSATSIISTPRRNPKGYFYPKDPEFKKKFGPRGVLHTWANPDGTQKIEDTGPLNVARLGVSEAMGLVILVRSMLFTLLPRREEDSKVGGQFMDVLNGDCRRLSWSCSVVRRRYGRQPQEFLEPGRREHEEIVVLDVAGIA
jgi:hypothetical protein